MSLNFVLRVDFKALDRLVDYLEAKQQGQIDAATAAITALTGRLKQSSDTLGQAVQQND